MTETVVTFILPVGAPIEESLALQFTFQLGEGACVGHRHVVKPLVVQQVDQVFDEGGIGAAALVGNTCQGCRVSISPVELAAIRKLPPEEVKRCENCRRILVVE